jgi:hypothetical protein
VHKSIDDSSSPPLAHAVDYTASDEAARQLAHLILVPPHNPDFQAQACDAQILWRDMQASGIIETRQSVTNLAAETILSAPFALDPTLQPHHWEVETRFITGKEEATTTYSGPYINPPIQRWRVRYAGREHWKMFLADAATRQTITGPYEVQLDPQVAPAAQARATIALADATSLWLDTWTNGSLALAVDGNVIATSEPRPTLAGLGRPWEVVRFGPITLAAGQHAIEVRLAAPEGGPWVFGVLLVDEAGAPVVRCAHVIEVPTQKV